MHAWFDAISKSIDQTYCRLHLNVAVLEVAVLEVDAVQGFTQLGELSDDGREPQPGVGLVFEAPDDDRA